MRKHLLRHALLAAGLGGILSTVSAATGGFQEPLDVESLQIRDVQGARMSGVVYTGERLVSVGSGGVIAVSDDAGASWRQVPSPASSDLLAAYFPTPKQGWAVGHEGIILHSGDGGLSWKKQFDGRQAAAQLTAHFTALAGQGDPTAAALLEGVKLNYHDGPEQALLDVWFADERNGFAVGTFGTVFATRDGGATWESWMEKADNPEFLHYLAISGNGNDVYIASERGIVFKLDRQAGRLVQQQTGYAGSFFSIDVAAQGTSVVAAGLRGSLYRSDDAGANWQKMDSGANTALTDIQALEDGRIAVASVDGRLLVGARQAQSLTPLKNLRAGRYTSVAQPVPGKIVAAGYSGIRTVDLD
jgi:photosystem II stability/assembly factor-like uncharacterized protein